MLSVPRKVDAFGLCHSEDHLLDSLLREINGVAVAAFEKKRRALRRVLRQSQVAGDQTLSGHAA